MDPTYLNGLREMIITFALLTNRTKYEVICILQETADTCPEYAQLASALSILITDPE